MGRLRVCYWLCFPFVRGGLRVAFRPQRVSTELVQKTAARNELAEDRKEKWRVLESLQVGGLEKRHQVEPAVRGAGRRAVRVNTRRRRMGRRSDDRLQRES